MKGGGNPFIFCAAGRIHAWMALGSVVSVRARAQGRATSTGSPRAGMKINHIAAIAALALAGSMLVRTAVAADSARGTPGPAMHAPARASHTVAHARSAHAGRRAAHHRLARTRYGITAGDERPMPLHPAGRGPERRAALPRVHRSVRDHGGSRSGHRALATVPGLPNLLAHSVSQL